MLPLILSVVVGGGIGAALGRFGQCASGACPLTSTWWRGALYGAGLGLAFFVMSGGGSSTAMNQSTQNVKHITESGFAAEVVPAAVPVVVDFYATWCGPCKALAPVVDELAGRFAGRVKFVKVNVDEAPALARRFEIQGVPTLLFFRDGKVVDAQVGLASAGALQARLELLVGTAAAPTVVR